MLNQLYYCICYIFSRLHVLQVDPSILEDLDRVNEKTVFKALTKFKSEKSDPTFSFISDCLSNSCDDLINHVTLLFKWFLPTGNIPAFLLFCTIVPIVKDNLGDIASSDWLINILEGDKLATNELKFGF